MRLPSLIYTRALWKLAVALESRVGVCRTGRRLESTFGREMPRGPVVSLLGGGGRMWWVGRLPKRLSVELEEDVCCLAEVDSSCGRDCCLERILENEQDCAI